MGFCRPGSSLNLTQLTSLAVCNEARRALYCGSQRRNSPTNLEPNTDVQSSPFLFNWRCNGLWIPLKLLKNMLKISTRCLHLGHFQRYEFWTTDWDLSYCLFVFVFILWSKPFTAVLELKGTFFHLQVTPVFHHLRAA